MPDIKLSNNASRVIRDAWQVCVDSRHEFVTPEHLLFVLLSEKPFLKTMEEFADDIEGFHDEILNYLNSMERIPDTVDASTTVMLSSQMQQVISDAMMYVANSSATEVEVPHLVQAIFSLEDSKACYMLQEVVDGDIAEFMGLLITDYEMAYPKSEGSADGQEADEKEPWRALVECLNDMVDKFNPLIGREAELERTIQVLCRKDKNNP